ncbi:MAG: hypothetical protein JWO86_6287 [Myxococcaceae bacterium]|nr:hypothetical protein [Myxococcaceae bacterium]
MSNGGAQSASGIAAYRTARELGSRSPRSYAAVREPNELVVIHRFSRPTDPRAKSTASFVSPDGSVSLGSDAMASLVRDARCLLKNWHPNIARVRHVDLEDDELTVATELVDGATLADLFAAAAAQRAVGTTAAIAEPLLPLPVLVRILVDVVTGLSGLHGLRDDKGSPLGTIHGALSPANIVVGKDGVARLLNALRPRPLRIAAGTEAVGYAAPEALDLGATQDVRADLHSVGVIMWEGLTGRRLYEETDPTRVLARQREEDVPPPAFPAGSPFARLAEVTMRALAFDPSLRFKTAAELGAALRNIAATRIATGSVVAARVAELTGDRIRARRIELDPSTTGKRRLIDRSLRAAKPASPDATPAAPPTADHDTLPPGAMDPSDLGPPSSVPHEVSTRDFLDPSAAASAPARAPAPAPARAPAPAPARAPAPAPAPAPKKTLVGHAPPTRASDPWMAVPAPAPASSPALASAPASSPALASAPASSPALAAPKPVAKPAPPLIRKTANAASSASMRVATPAPAPAPAPRVPPSEPSVIVAPAVPVDEPAPAPAPAPAPISPPISAAMPAAPLVDSPNQAPPGAPARSSSPALRPAPVSVFDDVPAPPPAAPPATAAPPVAYAPVVHSTPRAAFTPTSLAPPPGRRRPAMAILLGCALALLLLVGFFAVRAMVAGPETKTTTASTGTATGTTATAATATASSEATTVTTAEAPKPNDEAKSETPPATSATTEPTPEATAAAAPTANATAAGDPTAVTRPPVPAGTGGNAGTAPAVQRPQPSGPARPKRPTYEPLGI